MHKYTLVFIVNQIITQKSVRITGIYTFCFLDSHSCIFKVGRALAVSIAS